MPGKPRFDREFRIRQILKAIAGGANSLEEIATRTHLAPTTVYQYALKANIDLPEIKKIKRDVQRNLGKINQAINEGAKSAKEISYKTELPDSMIRSYDTSGKIKIPVKRIRLLSRKCKEHILKAIEDGANSLESLCKKTGYKPSTLMEHCRRHHIQLPQNLEPYGTRPEIDELIEEGITLREIGDKYGVTKEAIRIYLVGTNQHSVWKEKRREKKQEKNEQIYEKKLALKNLVSVLKSRMIQLAQNESWQSEKAVEYILSMKIDHPDSYSYNALIKIFERYKTAMDKEEKSSLEDLGEGLQIHPAQISHILKRVELKPMIYPYMKKRVVLQKQQKESIKKGFGLEMNPADIGYFLNLPFWVINANLAKIGTRKIFRPIKEFMDTFKEGPYFLTYRLASQIYEASDLGFNKTEIAELFDTKEKLVDYSLEQRINIQPKIVHALRTLYSNRIISKPYLESNRKL